MLSGIFSSLGTLFSQLQRMAIDMCGLKTCPSKDTALNPPTSLTVLMIPVSLLSMTISKQTVQRSTPVTSSQIPKKWRSQPSKVQLNPELKGPLMLSTLFQYSTSTLPLYVSMKLFKIGDNFQIQVFSSPLTSQVPNFSVLTFSFYQSSRVPPKWTFWIPHSGMHRSQSKYFLKTFIIAEVDKILSTLLVVLKSHSKLAVTPSVVFFLMAQIIRVKNSSH